MILACSLASCFFAAADLPVDALDERAVLLEPLAPLLQLVDREVVLVLHLGDRIRGPEEVRELVDLRLERTPYLAEDHGLTCLPSQRRAALSKRPIGLSTGHTRHPRRRIHAMHRSRGSLRDSTNSCGRARPRRRSHRRSLARLDAVSRGDVSRSRGHQCKRSRKVLAASTVSWHVSGPRPKGCFGAPSP